MIAVARPFDPLPEQVGDLALHQDHGPRPILPAPADAPPARFGHPRFGQPTTVWAYRDANGALLHHVARFDTPAGKQVLPMSWCALPEGGAGWRWKAPNAPRPLYGVDRLAKRPDAAVLLVEGEKTADGAASRFPDHVGMTWSGGCNAVGNADLTPLVGRSVILWPDADDQGRKAVVDLADRLQRAGARDVRIVDVPETFPPKWDLADPLPDGVVEGELVTMLRSAKPASGDGPLPLFPELPGPEEYPVRALGPVMSDAASSIAYKVQVPVAIAAQAVLAAASLAAQAHADVRLPYGQVRPLSLYFVTIAGSGDRKTTADNEALWPIKTREKALKEQHELDLADWKIAHAVWAAERKRIEADKKLDQASRKLELEALGEEPATPLHPFLIAPDPTIEGLVKAWVCAPASLGLFSAEGGQFVGGHGMSPDHRLKTAAALSTIWDGQPIKRLRAADGVTILVGRRLALHLLIQPDAAARFLGDPVLRDQGLLSRVLVAAPASIAGSRLYREPHAAADTAIRTFGARILSLLEARWALAEGKRNELEPRILLIGGTAEAAWREFYNHVERQCGAGGELSGIHDFAAKAAEQAARIAGVLTLVDGDAATEITHETMANAIALMDWYVGEAQRLQRAARTDPRLVRARQLLDWLQTQEAEVDFRKILRLGPAATRTKQEADDAMSILIEHGWVIETSRRPRCVKLLGGPA